jgi:NAD(P)-dependent dehydrogenase (short-subunit alcohol dehydrogenase family)
MSRRFGGKVVLVTGGGSGIGLAAARAFAAEGASVVIADRDHERAVAGTSLIQQAGGRAASIAADISDPHACDAMVAYAMNAFGALHIAFNNAGVPSRIVDSFEDYSIEEWDRVLRTNLGGVFYSVKAEVPAMRSCGGTAIVNTASVMSLMASAGMASYVASKHGVAGLTKALALDLVRYGIRVNAVCPGFVDTPMLASAVTGPEARTHIESMPPVHRISTPEEIARVALFLASDESSYMIGALVSVDGGLSVQ